MVLTQREFQRGFFKHKDGFERIWIVDARQNLIGGFTPASLIPDGQAKLLAELAKEKGDGHK